MTDEVSRLSVSTHALADLAAPYDHIAAEDRVAAERLLDEILKKISWIAEARFRGVARDWILPGLRALPFKGRCIYFRIMEKEVRIVRVLHARQDVSRASFPNND